MTASSDAGQRSRLPRFSRASLHLTALLAALAVAGCATTRSVSSFLERGVDLNRYQSYSWGPGDRQGTGDPRLDNNEIFQERVQAAVDAQLAANGFKKTPGSPDVLVHFHASVQQRLDLQNAEPFTPCTDCKPFVYDAGTLVVDLVDPRTNNLLWRGWAEENIDGVIDNQQRLEERIDAAIERIFAKFPRSRSSRN